MRRSDFVTLLGGAAARRRGGVAAGGAGAADPMLDPRAAMNGLARLPLVSARALPIWYQSDRPRHELGSRSHPPHIRRRRALRKISDSSLPSHITPIVKPNIRDSTTTPELGSQ
jgi:hypothetical protein